MDNHLGYFSENYFQARNRFLAAGGKVEAEIVSYDHPQLGENQERLSTDVIYLGPMEPEKVLIVVSGVHGTEGFYGSALQLGLLDDPNILPIAKEIGILLIHGINPYGFSHMCRETEGNVDLNRNFIDHEKSSPNNFLYDLFAEEMVSKKISDFNQWSSLDTILGKVDPKVEASDLYSGQYSDPNGLFFGGHQATWSNKIFYQILEDFVTNVPEVVIIDLHTGYGNKGDMELYSLFPESSPEHQRVKELFYFETTLPSPYRTTGTLIQAAIRTLAPSHVMGVLLEMGSCSPSAVEALREDRWLALFGDPGNHKGREIKQKVKEALCPACPLWREDAFLRGIKVLKQSLFYLLQGLVTEKIVH